MQSGFRRDRVGRGIRRLSGGPFRWASPLIHPVVTGSQLGVARLLDRQGRPRPDHAEAADLRDRVTMIVKTFERPPTMRRLIRSARTVFPGRIVVADDSRQPLTELGDNVEIVALPFNVGLSAGRNAALARVDTEYVFLTDDDIVFTRGSDIVAMVDYLDAHPEVDLIAPQLVNLPYFNTADNQAQVLFPGAAPPLRQVGEDIGGATVVLKVANVFLARTEAIRAIGWDDDLRLVEHRDFFSRASGRLVCVQAEGVRAYHVRTPHKRFYMSHREDVAPSMAVLARKWGSRHPGDPVATAEAKEPLDRESNEDAPPDDLNLG